MNQHRTFVICFLALGAFFIFFRLGNHDMVSDDAHYAFRSIDYVDFLSSQNQTTPLQWFSKPPGWSRLSFHDAPPLVFLAQHISMKLFGVNTVAARLPSAFAGVVSLILAYVIARELYNRRVAIIALGLLAVSSYFIWISRIAYLEGIELACILGSIWCFIKSQKRQRWLLGWGVCLGLACLSKYTAFYLFPVFAIWTLWLRRDLIQRPVIRTTVAAIGIVFALFVPIIMYNVYMFRARGHFDMQFSILFGQSMSDWPIINRSIGSNVATNVGLTFQTIRESISDIWFVAWSLSLVVMMYEVLKRRANEHACVLLNVLCLTILFALLAPAVRYLPLYTPFIAIGIAYGCDVGWMTVSRLSSHGRVVRRFAQGAALVLFGLFVCYQAVFAVNSNHLTQPVSDSSFWLSRARSEFRGFRELDAFVSTMLQGVRPVRPISFADYHKIASTMDRATSVYLDERLKPFASLIVYDENMNWFGRFWTLERWMKTHYIPVLSIENTLLQAKTLGDWYRAEGIDSAYVIFPAGSNIVSRMEQDYNDWATPLRTYLDAIGIQPFREIRTASGEVSFVVYFLEPLWEILDQAFEDQ